MSKLISLQIHLHPLIKRPLNTKQLSRSHKHSGDIRTNPASDVSWFLVSSSERLDEFEELAEDGRRGDEELGFGV